MVFDRLTDAFVDGLDLRRLESDASMALCRQFFEFAALVAALLRLASNRDVRAGGARS